MRTTNANITSIAFVLFSLMKLVNAQSHGFRVDYTDKELEEQSMLEKQLIKIEGAAIPGAGPGLQLLVSLMLLSACVLMISSCLSVFLCPSSSKRNVDRDNRKADAFERARESNYLESSTLTYRR